MSLRRLIAAVALLVLAAAPDAGHAAAVNWQANAAHSGGVTAAPAPPLERKWQRRLGEATSYPVMAGRRVFITSAASGRPGQRLHALRASNGRTIWTRHIGGAVTVEPAYGDGRVFVITSDGVVQAIHARSGRRRWRREVCSYDAAPVYYRGSVYIVGCETFGRMYALRADIGEPRWTVPVSTDFGEHPVTIRSGRIFLAGSCKGAYAWSVGDGRQLWFTKEEPTCRFTSGSSYATVAHGGRVWAKSLDRIEPYNAILSEHTGDRMGRFRSLNYPAFLGTLMVTQEGRTLVGRHVADLDELWRLRVPGGLNLPPIAGPDHVYAATMGKELLVVSSRTGEVSWRGDLPGQAFSRVGYTSGLAVAPTRVLVPAEGYLTAFGSRR